MTLNRNVQEPDNDPKSMIPLCVDLDGTLIATDSLWEGFIALLFKSPISALMTFASLRRGRAAFKIEVAGRSGVAEQSLPLNPSIEVFLSKEIKFGRDVYIVTGAPISVANSVAKQFPYLAAVIATSEESGNLTSARKAAFLLDKFGEKGFDYIGDSSKDIPVWNAAATAYAANVSKSTANAAARSGLELHHISCRKFSWNDWRKQLRLHQALKNMLVFLPILLAHQIFNIEAVLFALLAMVSFSLVSFGSYIWNDLHDLSTDRTHPTKKNRPLAAGHISIPFALAVSLLLVTAGFVISSLVNPFLVFTLLIYLVVTVSYSAFIKSVAVADVIVLAALYTLRIIAGAAAIGVPLSIWVVLTSIFLFFSLALMKRYSEFVKYDNKVIAGRGYHNSDKPVILSTGIGSGLLAVLVVGLYVNADVVTNLYSAPEFLWGLLPLLLLWVTRLWFLTERGQMDDDPVAFAITDRVSQIIALLVIVLIVLATVVRF